jgi:hypothetical protein
MLFVLCIAFAAVAMLRHPSAASVTPWRIALGLNSGIWISDNGSGKGTTYDGTGQPLPSGSAERERPSGVTLTSVQRNNVVANVRKIFSYGRRNGYRSRLRSDDELPLGSAMMPSTR